MPDYYSYDESDFISYSYSYSDEAKNENFSSTRYGLDDISKNSSSSHHPSFFIIETFNL